MPTLSPSPSASPSPPAHLLDDAANILLASHYQRIRFQRLHTGLLTPDIHAALSEFYSAELLTSVSAKSLDIFTHFERAGDAMRSLDGSMPDLEAWVRAYKEGRAVFEEAVGMMREFEAGKGWFAVEWEVKGKTGRGGDVKEMEEGLYKALGPLN